MKISFSSYAQEFFQEGGWIFFVMNIIISYLQLTSGTPQAYHGFNIFAQSRLQRTTRTMVAGYLYGASGQKGLMVSLYGSTVKVCMT